MHNLNIDLLSGTAFAYRHILYIGHIVYLSRSISIEIIPSTYRMDRWWQWWG